MTTQRRSRRGYGKGEYQYSPPMAPLPTESRRLIEAEFAKWNQQAGETVITDWDLPMSQKGVTVAIVVFYLRDRKIPVSIDKWGDFATNLKCVQLNIQAMRLAEARGSLESLAVAAAASMGLVAVESSEEADLNRAYALLQVRRDADLNVIERVYRGLINEVHPDKPGGSEVKTRELNNAIEAIRKSRPGR